MSKSVHKKHKNNLQPKAISTHTHTKKYRAKNTPNYGGNETKTGWPGAELNCPAGPLTRHIQAATHFTCFPNPKVSVYTQSSCLSLTNSIPDDSPSDERNSGHMTTVSTLELRRRKRRNWRSASVTSQERMPNCLLPVNAHSYAAPGKHLGPTEKSS